MLLNTQYLPLHRHVESRFKKRSEIHCPPNKVFFFPVKTNLCYIVSVKKIYWYSKCPKYIKKEDKASKNIRLFYFPFYIEL